ncbi:Major facilitator-type transporter psiT2 [Psilocybe cubensis]|uniref:Major facilitator superfamily (MFS) profile domain-containing protein n=2 Tax=Psilocybe cubensis TaxID=181762 RepID=A0A8H8CM86_PSICU|nr:Major facilitator-type transporter psiT2 [Psilocybe cubensis]KAH9481773.1 Major facilitator-type transporter psiT2 [Psilocybe cubensis]
MSVSRQDDESLTILHDGNDQNDYDHDDHEKPTPLPVYPLLSLYLIQMAEPITATVIYPFINQFVRETGITGGDEKKTGYYAGIIESAFFFAESFTVVQWGYISDKYGRRPILLCGPIGLAVAMLIFGTSTTFWPLVVSRCLQGIFNGNIGVTKSSIAELTDSTNRADAYAFIPMVWSVGYTTGPIIGGILSNPATRWPDTLGRIAYLRTHPYFLPCLVAASFAFATFIFVCFALKETLPSLVGKEKVLKHHKRTADDAISANVTTESSLLEHGDHVNYGTDASVDQSQQVSIRAAITRPILMVLVNHIFLTFLDMANFTLVPLVYSTPISYGGLGLDPFRIGVILGTFGLVNSFVQANLLGRSIKKCGARRLYKATFSCLLGCFTMYPILHFFAQRSGRVDGFVIASIVIQLGFQSMIYMAYGSLQVILVECVPEGGPMGTVNGVAQMLGSGMRSLAPTFASSLFSISLQRKLAGENMVFYILMALTLTAMRASKLLPDTSKPRRTRSPRNSRAPSTTPAQQKNMTHTGEVL